MRRPILQILLAIMALCSVTVSVFAFRVYKAATTAYDAQDTLRYLVDDQPVLGTSPSSVVLSPAYLKAVFGDNEALLAKLREKIDQGLRDSTKLRLGEVSAMLVTYRLDDAGEATDITVIVFGGLDIGRRVPGFNRDGYFKRMVDRNLWNAGNTVLAFLGREMNFFAEEKQIQEHKKYFDALATGEVMPIVEAIRQPMYYSLVFPSPRRLLPPQLRPHISTIIFKGSMQLLRSDTEILMLCNSPRSATLAARARKDVKLGGEAILKTRFGGVVEERSWGHHMRTWWAYEMVRTSEKAILKADRNLIRFQVAYGRVMNNAILKVFERMGRDLLAMSLTMDQQLDPRQTDARLASRHTSHYWGNEHRWGPNWPILPPMENGEVPAPVGIQPDPILDNPVAPAAP
jgi:hypothetical protein